MAPEQARGDAAVDHRAEIFSLGAMMGSIADTAPVLAIARKARAADPGDRYLDVPALSADISRFLAGLAVEAHREPWSIGSCGSAGAIACRSCSSSPVSSSGS